MANKYAVREFVCAGCGVHVKQHARPAQRYCSLECYRRSKRPQRMTGGMMHCQQCGCKFYTTASQLPHRQFCSLDCANAYQSRNKTTHICKTCGKEFKWSPSRSVQQNPTYCSTACRTVCPDWKRNSVIAGNITQQNNKAPTSLEVAGAELLNRLGVAFDEQVLIADKFLVDVLLPAHSIVIQWDGDYWHGYDIPDDKLDDRQAKRRRLDKSQDAYMRKCGYTVLRYWEHEVHNTPEVVIAAIESAVRQASA